MLNSDSRSRGQRFHQSKVCWFEAADLYICYLEHADHVLFDLERDAKDGTERQASLLIYTLEMALVGPGIRHDDGFAIESRPASKSLSRRQVPAAKDVGLRANSLPADQSVCLRIGQPD